MFRERGCVPPRPAAGTRTQVGTLLPSASICSLWTKGWPVWIWRATLVKLFGLLTFLAALLCLVGCASDWRASLSCYGVKEDSWRRPPNFSEFLVVFSCQVVLSLPTSPPVEVDFDYCCLLQKNVKIKTPWL